MDEHFTVTIDERFYEQLARGNVSFKTPNNCAKCKQHRKRCQRLSKAHKSKGMSEEIEWKPSPLHKEEMSANNQENSPFVVVNVEESQSQDNSTIVSEGVKCRYCYALDDGNLIAPCRCAGSSKYVHRKCLEKWLTLRNKNNCELCKTLFQTKLRHNPLWKLRFPQISHFDVLLIVIAVSFYVTLVLQFLGAVFVGVMETLPLSLRNATITGLSFGIFWFLVGSITVSIIIYNSDYWREFRKLNRTKVLVMRDDAQRWREESSRDCAVGQATVDSVGRELLDERMDLSDAVAV